MCRTLGIEHEEILCLGNLRQVSINVASFKYIKFGKMYTAPTDKKLISMTFHQKKNYIVIQNIITTLQLQSR